MTDQKPDAGDNTVSKDNEATPPEQPEETEAETRGDAEATEPEESEAGEATEAEDDESEAEADESFLDEAAADEAAAGEAAAEVVAETEAEAADAAAAGAAWTTTPVAPDPEATEAALAALAAKPEVTIEPPETPPPPPPGDEEDEGTPVLLVGGILVGAFIVALAIVLILFRPFDNLTDPDASLSPSPVVTEQPSESLSAIATVDTPNFQGLPLEEAEITATDYGLVVRVEPVETDDVEPGTVIGQEPSPGEPVDEGSTIELAVAQPVPTASVPDVVGLDESAATDILEQAGFVVGDVALEFDDDIAAGDVISTDPPIDTELPQGTAIDLVISDGPELTPVPDLADQPEADALDLLDAAGLAAGARTEAASETVAAGNVISSDPAADAEVAPGTEVAYVVSTGPELTPVPDLADQPEADALDLLDAAGLAAGARTEAASETVAAGNVISSDPAADAEVAPGTEVAYVVSTGPELTPVPDLADQPEADALDLLDAAGLAAGARTEAASETVAAGNVISSDPAADAEVAPGSEIDYTISIGPEQVEVPGITGLAESDALDAIDGAGLNPGARSEAYSDTAPAGDVVSQDPAAGAMADIGSAVAYVVSLGVETVAVPDLSGPAAAAPDAITSAGLTVGAASEDFSDTVAAGDVVSQDPAAGTEVELGTAVSYVESLGVQQVEVPDLSGPAAEADQRITDAGFVVGVTFEVNSDTIPAGDVNDQDPNAGEMAPPGSEIDYTISIGPEQVEVPGITGLAESDALDAIDGAGLNPGARSEAYSDTAPAGDVVSQDPAAGAMADIGSAVAYVVSLGVETVAVPDLSGPAAAAPDAITSAGLTVGAASEDFSDTVAAGDVVSQDPAAGTEVELGTAVSYVESLGVQQVEVPDLSGPAAEADQRITDAGFVVGVTFEVNSDTIPAGDVNDQDPNAGEMAPPGSEIDYTISIGPEQVEVPGITGLAESDALDAIDGAGLNPGARSEAYSDTAPAGDVVSQDPAAGAMADIGSAVAYVVSLGVETVAVPDLSGPAAAAPDAITSAGLTVGAASEDFSDTVAAGDVVSQDPAAGTEVELGTAVSYVESLGVQQVEVPDLSGPAAEADQRITDAGFVVGVTFEVNSDTIPAGDVNDQDPNAGEMAPPGSEIDYTISIGPEQVEVPGITGLAESDALDAIDGAGLNPGARSEAYSDTAPAGDVVSQDPAAGAMADIGSAVAYVVSLGVETVAVPDLSGPAAAAPDAITSAGLTVGAASEDFSDTVAAGDVVSQDPAAGTEVELGTAVSYVESLGVQQVEVPDLSGPAAEADQRITDAGFVVGVTFEVNSDTIPAGDVNDQDPNAGEMAPPGSEIDYTISIGPEQVEVPGITGLAESDALDAIDGAGLNPGARSEAYSDTAPAGDVVSQDPAAGAMADIGSAVAYVVSLGVETVAVPDLSGPAAAAPDAITSAGLTVGAASEDFSDTVAAGDVVSQDPAAGTEVELGTAVSYVESLGVQQVEVPDLSGPAAEADQRITDAGFVVGVTFEVNSDTIPAGDVNDQDPNAGEMAPPGSEIDYTISIGPEQVEVPGITGLAESDALDAIDGAGLNPGARSEAYSDTAPAGDVVSQDPAAGAMADIGSAVAYVVSLGVETVAVPDLSGPAAAAPDAITSAGLTVGAASEDFSDTVAAGDVVSQDPAAGTEVELGTAVSYVESLGVQQVEVPDLSGPAAEADQRITDAGFVVGVTFEVNSDTIPAGDVNDQDPNAGEMAPPGSEIDYTISIGPEQVEVPGITGLAESDALDAIDGAGLNPGARSEAYSDTAPAGDVVSQDPAAGAMADIGSAVAYVVSLGVETVAVPDLSGPAAAAPDAITSAGLTVGAASEDFSDTVAAGDVVSQDPAAGTEVELGTAVSYVESLGVQQVEVPVVRESSLEDATAAIEAAGLAVDEVIERNHDSVPAGAALRTDPAAGETVDIGSAVSLFMSIGPEQVEVPVVVGMTEADAIAAIESARLTVGEAATVYSDTVPAGSVTSTSPTAGTTLDANSAVDYVLSLGIEQVVVPDVTATAQADAVAAVEAAGLRAGEISNDFDEAIAAGSIVTQDPVPGSEVDKGSEVALVVSDGPTPFVEVPATRDLSEVDATSAIEDVDLVVGAVEYRTHEKVATGAAIRTEPPAGEEVLLGDSVRLFISSGSQFRTVPDVAGQAASDAQATLEAEDLTVATEERNNANVPAGQAVKTEPAAGTEVNVGDEITLVVSRGPKQVDIPDVVGMARADARTAITDAELKVGDESVVEDDAAQNTVIAQDPVPGGQTNKNATVNITVSSGPPQVVIPAVRDVEAGEAQVNLEDLGLVVETKEVFHANVAAGNAIKTAPGEGTPVAVGSTVTMNVSKGPKPVEVPEVTGLKKGAATSAIEDAGLTVGEQTSVEDASDKNTVIAQDPVAGSEVPNGSAVALTVSSGPPTATIPDVRDVAAADAQATLEALGLVVETKEVFHARVAAGDAIKTNPAAGKTVAVGSTVTMNVSKGPKPVEVPEVTGLKKGAATSAIEDAGLTVGEQTSVEDASDKNTVIAQDPVAGSEVPNGSAVALTVSSGPPTATIPDVRDVAAADAQATLEALGLVVETKEVFHARVAAGDAIKTNPAAGKTVAVGSTVTMNVSKGPKPVEVPEVTGLKKGAATSAIEDAGLTVGEQTSVEDAADRNTVLSQDPPAGSEVATGSAVNLTISSGPPQVTIPDVRDVAEARAVNDLENLGLVVETKEVFHARVAAGDAIKTNPAAGETVNVGSTVTMNVSKGIKQVTVPDLVGLAAADVEATLKDAELNVGNRSEAENDAQSGTVIEQSPAAGSTVDKNSPVDYIVSAGPAIEQMGLGGDLGNPEIMSQLDTAAGELEPIRELELGNTPYDGSNARQHELALAERIGILRDPGAIKAEERALKRLGLLDDGDDLAALLESLYGQALPVAYFEDDGHLSVLEGIDSLDAGQRAQAARELDRALTDQSFGLQSTRVGDKSRGDEALAGYALEQGDGTAAMIDWSAAHGNNNQTNQVIVPGDDGIYASMPLILQREYSLPFLEGRIFVDRLQGSGGWNAVNDAWGSPPESTEQILHPKLYPNERPTTVVMDDVAGRIGGGWSADWQQTMGELRIGVWLADGAAGEQSGPKAAVKLPRANAAAGWGGDRLLSLSGPDGQWAIVWQTKWDSGQDVDQFVNAADRVLAGLGGAGLVAAADVSNGVSNPAVVIITGSGDTLASVADALGVIVPTPA